MKAVMLAAGVGVRMGAESTGPPKVMLRFGGRSLLDRHIEILQAVGVDELVLGVGYQAEVIESEIAGLGAEAFVRTVFNPRYEEGSLLTMLALGEAMGGGDVLLMDGDVLYDRRLMQRLMASRHRNCFLIDQDFEPGDEPVKLCLRDGAIVDFHKKVGDIDFDSCGESVGFFRFEPAVAVEILAAGEAHAAAGRHDLWYEEAIRDVLLEAPNRFGYEDITGLPWIEIDFPEDIRRAESEVLPRLSD
ncbi:MAG: NTP transferase domain-containing protein [Kiloniellales bacterium]